MKKPRTASFRACVVMIFVGPVLFAQRPEEELLRENASARFHGHVGRALPVVSLPAKVPAPEGKFTLWADFAAADPEGVPLYVVNQTNKEQAFSTQDMDIYAKLEFKDATGAWRRAQAHLSSWCGNSYFPVTLPPRQFFVFRGYRPAAGNKQIVRYAIHGGDLASNESEGMVSDADLKAVAVDSLTAGEIPYYIWRAFETNQGDTWVSEPSLERRVELIRMLNWYPRNELVILRAREFRGKVLALTAGDQRDALIKAIDDCLANVDAPRPSPSELVHMCIARIADDPKADATLSKEMAWRLLVVPSPSGDALATSANGAEPAQWRGVIAPAVALMKESRQSTQGGGADAVLSAGWIVDALVKDDELVDWLAQASSERLRYLGAAALARRSRFSTLVDFAWKQPGPVQIMILQTLTRTGSSLDQQRLGVRQPDFSNNEHLFWQHCARTMPVETANALWSYDFRDGYNPYNRLIHDPLRDYFAAEAARSSDEVEISQQDAYSLQTALRMLVSWRMEEDDKVMQALLKHGGYLKQESRRGDNFDRHVVTKRFVYREIAKQALLARGQPVPTDLVLEAVISDVQKKRGQ